MPEGDTFCFHAGPLLLAMEAGNWFLADELNLAPPAMLSMLAPLLEGKRSLLNPSTGKEVTADPNFRFFATQNLSTYANRNPLPTNIRSRFLEVHFSDFDHKVRIVVLAFPVRSEASNS